MRVISASFARPTSENTPSRDCLESTGGHQIGATQAGIEGREGRIFALQASDLASLRPLQPSFQTVSPGSRVNKGKQRAECPPSNTLWRLLVRLTLPQPWSSKRSKGSHARVTMLIAEAGGDTARAAAARLHAHRIPEFAITIVEARLKNVAVL